MTGVRSSSATTDRTGRAQALQELVRPSFGPAGARDYRLAVGMGRGKVPWRLPASSRMWSSTSTAKLRTTAGSSRTKARSSSPVRSRRQGARIDVADDPRLRRFRPRRSRRRRLAWAGRPALGGPGQRLARAREPRPPPGARRAARRVARRSGGNIRPLRRERHGRDSDNRPDEGLRRGARALRPRPRGPRGARSSASSARTAPGKSTTMRLLLDLIKPTSGSATLLGLDSRGDSLEIRRRVGFLPGDLALYPKLTGVGDARLPRPSCAAASTGACATSWPSASTPSSTARCASSRRATARSSGSSRRSCTSRSC